MFDGNPYRCIHLNKGCKILEEHDRAVKAKLVDPTFDYREKICRNPENIIACNKRRIGNNIPKLRTEIYSIYKNKIGVNK